MNARVKDIVLNEDGSVKHYLLTSGEIVQGDLYMSAVPGVCLGRVLCCVCVCTSVHVGCTWLSK